MTNILSKSSLIECIKKRVFFPVDKKRLASSLDGFVRWTRKFVVVVEIARNLEGKVLVMWLIFSEYFWGGLAKGIYLYVWCQFTDWNRDFVVLITYKCKYVSLFHNFCYKTCFVIDLLSSTPSYLKKFHNI